MNTPLTTGAVKSLSRTCEEDRRGLFVS